MQPATESGKTAPHKMTFTHALLTGVQCPAGKDRIWIYDAKTPCLTMMVTANGAKSFYFLKKHNRRFIRLRLGGFPELHLDDARQAVAERAGEVARGVDPAERRRAERAQMTLGELFDYYLTTHAKVKKRRWQEDEAQFNRYMAGWKGRKINAIQHADMQALHAKIGRDNGHHAANRLLALLHKMFNIASAFGIEKNPARGIDKFRETSRERFVGPDEMPRLLKAIEKEIDPFRDFFLLALMTGGRRSNLQAMRWDEINLKAHTWTIPGNKAKAHKAIVVPLVDETLKILKNRLRARTDQNEWVFPSYGKAGHITEPKMAWQRVLKRAKISDLRIHDLRRTMGSYQAATGASLQMIGASLGHRNVATTAIYSRLNLDPVRASVEAGVKAMLGTPAKKKSSRAKAHS